ncbi:MAG: BlaI/MecI/CopY family transcriptional regulator [Acidobacteriota bacterium]
MSRSREDGLSRRERQIMDAIHRRGKATVNEVLAEIPDPPSYSAVRATLGILYDKGKLRRKKNGRRFVYSPTVTQSTARQSALRHVLATFFDNSTERVVSTLLDMKAAELDDDEIERIRRHIDQVRQGED